MAAVMPHTTPWSNAVRGSSEGVKARQAKASATQAPGRVERNRRRPAAGAGAASRWAPAPSALGPPSSSALELSVGAWSPWVVIVTSPTWQLGNQGHNDTEAVDGPMGQDGSEEAAAPQ